MGQYYKPVALGTKEYVYSHSYDNGLKLMEHSWIDNRFVGAVEKLITKGGAWYGKQIVWAGDYADPEVDNDEQKLYYIADIALYPKLEDNYKSLRFLKNLDTKEYVDLNKVPITYTWVNPDNSADKRYYRIHPLPLLTCEGNGRGGGDFHGKDESELIGKWSRNKVVMQKSKPKGYKELVFDLVENW